MTLPFDENELVVKLDITNQELETFRRLSDSSLLIVTSYRFDELSVLGCQKSSQILGEDILASINMIDFFFKNDAR